MCLAVKISYNLFYFVKPLSLSLPLIFLSLTYMYIIKTDSYYVIHSVNLCNILKYFLEYSLNSSAKKIILSVCKMYGVMLLNMICLVVSGYIYNFFFLNASMILNLLNIIQQIWVFRSQKVLSNKKKNNCHVMWKFNAYIGIKGI